MVELLSYALPNDAGDIVGFDIEQAKVDGAIEVALSAPIEFNICAHASAYGILNATAAYSTPNTIAEPSIAFHVHGNGAGQGIAAQVHQLIYWIDDPRHVICVTLARETSARHATGN